MVEYWTANPKVVGSKLAAARGNFFQQISVKFDGFHCFQPFEEGNLLKKVCKHCFADSFQNVLKAVKIWLSTLLQ